MEEGTLIEWTIAEGDTIVRGDVVAVIETQKGAIEIESFDAGVVSEIFVDVGKVVPVGTPMALIGDPTSQDVPDPNPTEIPEAPPATGPSPPLPELPDQSPLEFPDQGPTGSPKLPPEEGQPSSLDAPVASAYDLRTSPAARARARELCIDLRGVKGTGPDGVIVLSDVERTQPATDVQQALDPPPRDAKAEMRAAIAATMARSKRTIPHFYLSQAIDAQPALGHLATLNEGRDPGERLLLGAALARATALAAKDCPTLNGHYVDTGFHPSAEVNVGLAIALRGGGLVAPALMHADGLSLHETMAAMRDLVIRARTGRLRGREMTASTITLSSLGETGAETMSGVIFPPQVALVCFGAPKVRPWIVGGTVKPRSVIQLTLSVDHRANDARQASRFVTAFESYLQSPEKL